MSTTVIKIKNISKMNENSKLITFGLPSIQQTNSLQNLNTETTSIDLNKNRVRRHSKIKNDKLESSSMNINSKSANKHDNSDYNDVSKIKSQISSYKENIAKSVKLSKPINLVDSFYNLGAHAVNGKHVNFNQLNECVLLVVNIATCDPRTTDELRQLNEIVNQFNTKGFAVLAFLCNQFNNSQPWENDEVMKCLKFVRPGQKYEPNFPIFATCDVNGSHTLPIYDYLKSKQPFPLDDFVTLSSLPDNRLQSNGNNNIAKFLNPSISWNPVHRSDIGGNFEKFLIDRTGQVVSRYTRRKPISLIINEIEQLLSKRSREARPNICHDLASHSNII